MAVIKVINEQSIVIGDLDPNELFLIKLGLDFYKRQRWSKLSSENRSFIDDFTAKTDKALHEYATLQN